MDQCLLQWVFFFSKGREGKGREGKGRERKGKERMGWHIARLTPDNARGAMLFAAEAERSLRETNNDLIFSGWKSSICFRGGK